MDASDAQQTPEEGLRRAAEDLRSTGAAWALVGGIAVSAWVEPRFTKDVDAAVAVESDAEAEAVVRALLLRGYAVEWELEQTATKRLAGMRLRPPGSDAVVVDLLFASSGIEPEVVAAAVEIEILPGFLTPVARSGHLIALKALSVAERRGQDLIDIEALIRASTTDDLALARSAVALIEARGYARGKDLEGDLEGFIARFSS